MRAREFHGTTWWYLTLRFDSTDAARGAWGRLNAEGVGRWNVGVYRHGAADDTDPANTVFVTVVGMQRKGVAAAEQLLGRDGASVDLDDWAIDSFIARRVRVVVDLRAQGAREGRYAIRRGSRGGRLHGDGTMDEQTGGDQ